MPDPTPAISQALRHVADHLTATNPDHLMTPEARHNAAFTIAHALHTHDHVAAADLINTLLRHMPFVDGKAVTNGEYALWLHKTSWSI